MSDTLATKLRQRIRGEVRFDTSTRVLYSTDASIYQIMPIGVVIPRDVDDIVATVQICAEQKVPILPRGSGTSLGGQTVGRAVVLDCSKYMNRVLELNADERWVRVQPGVVLDELNAQLSASGLQFAPDVATSDRASIGGMIGNNSCGAHSVIYGKTVDHVKELCVVLSDGRTATLGPGDPRENSRESELTAEIRRIASENREEILARYPKILRRVGGYNLDRFLPREDQRLFAQPRLFQDSTELNLAKIAVGSEGTLCTLTESKLNLVPLPKAKGLCAVHFADLYESLEAAPIVLQCEPSAVELTDKFLLDLTKDNINLARNRSWIQGDPAAVLVVEFYGDSREEIGSRIESLKSRLHSVNMGYAFYEAYDSNEQALVWGVRKSGLGLLMGLKGDAKPQGFIEDTAVPPEHLAEYIRRLTAMINRYGYRAVYYAHASVGCLHVRPVMSIKTAEGIRDMHAICREACDLVLEYGGSFSSEHGDGLVRSEFIERAFGDRLYNAFKQAKHTFDPAGIMNPGKIVEAPKMTENLRVANMQSLKQVSTYYSWDRDGGLLGHIELCSGVGACRKKMTGTMCPSYRATMDEKDTTRARANMFRSVLTGVVSADELASYELHDVLDLCLECKACKAECPSNVDMAKLKSEFLSHYQEKRGVPIRSRILAGVALSGRLASRAPKLANALMNTGIVRWILSQFGLDRRRTLPQFAAQTFAQWFKEHEQPQRDRRVILLNDTFTNYHDPQIGIAAVGVLNALGYRVDLAMIDCCGRPMISKGMLAQAKSLAKQNTRCLKEQLADELFIVGCEPSCISAVKDDYLDLSSDADTRYVAERTMMIEEFVAKLLREAPSDLRNSFISAGRKFLFHGHCHQKALFGTNATLDCLRLAGFKVEEVPSGCCGMAGSFGYETEHYDLSMQIGELVLFPALRAAQSDLEILAEGTSCRHQILDGTGRKARHPIEVLAEAIRK